MNIYGHFFSAPSNKVRYCASALGLDFTYHHVDLQQGEQQHPDFLDINQLGKVPAIEDNGFVLSESDAICRYLANKSGKLYPDEIQTRARIDRWMDIAAQTVLLQMSKILFNRFFAPMLGEEPNQTSIDEGQRNLAVILPHINTQLTQTKYLGGNELSIADISMLAAIDPFDMIEIDLSIYPDIQQWREELMQHQFYQDVHQHFAAEMEQGKP